MTKPNKKQHKNPMRFYEGNYHLLQELLPEMLPNGCHRYYFYGSKARFRVEVLETAAYTQELKLFHQLDTLPEFLPGLGLDVRVYHDARLAEVHAVNGVGRLVPKIECPNNKMLHKDEKQQANFLLHEWLMRAITSMALIKSEHVKPERKVNEK